MPVPAKTSASTKIILLLGIASLFWYAAFLFSPSHAGHPLAYVLLLIAEAIGMSQLIGMWSTILFAHPQEMPSAVLSKKAELARGRSVPSIALLITAAGEPVSVIRETALAARDMRVAHHTLILDDGSSDAVKAMAQDLGIEYVRRRSHEGRKAGNVNHALKQVKTDYFAIFDCDHVPSKEFLLETLPYLLCRPSLGYVQTPQHYGNTNTFIAGGSAEIQDVFYRHVQVGKNAFNAAFCVGTNVLFRRAAVDDIGGMYHRSNSEDIWTALLMHEEGWDSFFLGTVLACGHAPETVAAYLRQQFRWARGGFEIFFTRNPLFSQKLSLDQKLQYLCTISHYFSSVSILIYFLLPLLYVYFGIKPLESPEGGGVWALHFFPYYVLLFATSAHLMEKIPSWRSFVIATTSFPSHLMALLSVVTRLDLRWSVTGEIRRSADYIQSVIPQIFLLLLSAGAIPLVLLQRGSDWWMNALMVLWLGWNCALLFSLCKRALPSYARAAHASFSPAVPA